MRKNSNDKQYRAAIKEAKKEKKKNATGRVITEEDFIEIPNANTEILEAVAEIKKDLEKFHKEWNETIELLHEDLDFIKGRLLRESHGK